MIHQRYRRTDDMQSQDRALHYSASRSKKVKITQATYRSVAITTIQSFARCCPL